MTILFLRLLSWITAILALGTALWQWDKQHFALYPWPLVIFFVWYAFALGLLAWRRLSWRDALEKIFPSFLVSMTVCFGFLMTETTIQRFVVTMLFVGIPFLILELLFLFLYAPSRYPVSGLSRVNITLIPLGAFFLASSLNGLFVFLRIQIWIPLVVSLLFAALAYFLTAHPTADHRHRIRWGLLGALIGLHVGFLGLLLPFGMFVHGALSALFVSLPLRMRRYAFQPKPSRKLAMAESTFAIILLGLILGTSRWI